MLFRSSVSTIENITNVTGSLYFNLGISSISASYGIGSAGSPASAVVTITDNETGSVRFTATSYTGSQNSTIPIYIERYIASGAPDLAATATVYVSASSTAIAGVDYADIFPYNTNIKWEDQVSGTVSFNIITLGSWSSSKILNLYLSSLTNVGSGSIMSASILITSNVQNQSLQPSASVGADYTINDYINASSQFTRRTEQVPFFAGSNPFVRLKQAYSSST